MGVSFEDKVRNLTTLSSIELVKLLSEEVVEEAYKKLLIQDFIEDIHCVLAEADVEYPAGRDSYPKIIFNEEDVESILRNFINSFE